MARKSNAQLRKVREVQELRRSSAASPIPLPRHRGSRSTRESGARAWEMKLVD